MPLVDEQKASVKKTDETLRFDGFLFKSVSVAESSVEEYNRCIFFPFLDQTLSGLLPRNVEINDMANPLSPYYDNTNNIIINIY